MARTAEQRAARTAAERDRYANDAEYREKVREYQRAYYAKHHKKAPREKKPKMSWKERYATDPEFREKQKSRARASYNIEYHRRRTYGVTADQFDAMFTDQDGRCAIPACSKKLARSGRDGAHIDHCHKTGKVRALLCGNCNASLGMLGEDPERMRDLAAYAEQHAVGGDAT